MKTVTIIHKNEPREMPVEGLEGCGLFEVHGRYLYFLVPDDRDPEDYIFAEWGILTDYDKRHAACVAFSWYTHLANEARLKRTSDPKKALYHKQDQIKFEAAVEAWRTLQDWRVR